jgi:tryptophanyl-tRNA synthetase
MRLVSGIRPSGELTIANYLGAIKQWIELQDQNEAYFFIADLHAITTPYNPRTFRENIIKTLALYVASGLDPKKSTIFLQSKILEHTQLAWLFSTLTPVGELERMTQYKEKVKEGSPANVGLFSYPILMAADILIYKAEGVPVGEDQIQHVELAREIAKRFNKRFGTTFPLPKAILTSKELQRIKSLQNPGKKMSKSSEDPNGAIMLLDPPQEIHKKIKIAVTDSGREIIYNPDKKPAISNLISIYSGFSGKDIGKIEEEFKGRGYAEFKESLSNLLVDKLGKIQKEFTKLIQNPEYLEKIIEDGNKKAKAIASQTLKEVKEKMGINWRQDINLP